MTLALRNTIITLGFIIACLVLVASAVLAFNLFVLDGALTSISTAPQTWLFWSWNTAGLGSWRLIAPLFTGLVSVFGMFTFSRYFRKNTDPQVFFFSVFLFSLAFHMLKIGAVAVEVYDQAPVFGALLTRVMYFGKTLGIAGLFSAGVYAVGAHYQKLASILGILAILSFALSYTVPVRIDALLPSLSHQTSLDLGLQVLYSFLIGATLLNYALAAYMLRRQELLLLGAALAVAGISEELLFAMPNFVVTLIAFVLIVVSTAIYGRRNYTMFIFR